jgi:membrane associated rhomboid family serine protease
MSYGSYAGASPFPSLTPAIKLLILINVAVFVLNAILRGAFSDNGAWLAFSWAACMEGYGLGAIRVLTYQFTHAFASPGHLLWNMLTLYFFGTMVEGAIGYRGTIRLYLWGGVFGALMHLCVALLMGYENVPLVGASGACYAFLVHAACLWPRAQVIVILFPVPLGWLAAGLVAMGLYEQYVEIVTGSAGSVANSAHLGGALLGFLAWKKGWFRDYGDVHSGGVFAGLGARFRRGIAARAEAKEVDAQREMDRILEKIQREGLPSLTNGERRTLEQASERARRK